MKKLPKTVSSFSKMIEGDFLYIDKTEYIYNLLQSDSYYFLSRPRRFGKTLLISTLEEIFSANKKLFDGLWIDKSDYSWGQHPVIRFDFSQVQDPSVDELKRYISWTVQSTAKHYEVDLSDAPTLSTQFITLVMQMAQQGRVVILVDEYDYPLLNSIGDIQLADAKREVLKGLFSAFKSLDQYLRFVFITGVTKFCRTSIFSGANNLNDISFKEEGAVLLGYTYGEIDTYFTQYIDQFAREKKRTCDEIRQEMAIWYNGYRFFEDGEKVYNPFSVQYYLADHKQMNYWAQSATPSFLVHLLKNQHQSLQDIQGAELSESALGTFEVNKIPLVSLLFQAGYLTIAGYNKQTHKYRLAYPNKEVEQSFNKFLLTFFTDTTEAVADTRLAAFKDALEKNDIERFCTALQVMLAGIPYNLHIEQESYYHSLFQVLAYLLDYDVHAEVMTSKGRIDLVVTTKDRIFIFEFKFEGTGKQALEQIDTKRYAQKFALAGRAVTLVGLSFNFKDKKLYLDWMSKEQLK